MRETAIDQGRQLIILVVIALLFIFLKKSGEHTEPEAQIQKGITTVSVKGADNQIEYTEVSYEESSVKIYRSDYESDAEFELAVVKSRRTLKERDPSDVEVIIEIDNSSPVLIETISEIR